MLDLICLALKWLLHKRLICPLPHILIGPSKKYVNSRWFASNVVYLFLIPNVCILLVFICSGCAIPCACGVIRHNSFIAWNCWSGDLSCTQSGWSNRFLWQYQIGWSWCQQRVGRRCHYRFLLCCNLLCFQCQYLTRYLKLWYCRIYINPMSIKRNDFFLLRGGILFRCVCIFAGPCWTSKIWSWQLVVLRIMPHCMELSWCGHFYLLTQYVNAFCFVLRMVMGFPSFTVLFSCALVHVLTGTSNRRGGADGWLFAQKMSWSFGGVPIGWNQRRSSSACDGSGNTTCIWVLLSKLGVWFDFLFSFVLLWLWCTTFTCVFMLIDHQFRQGMGVPSLSVVNAVGSLIARTTKCGVYTNAGREHAVASTKVKKRVLVIVVMTVFF